MPTDAVKFFDSLFGAKDDEDYILVWTLPDKRSHWFRDVGKASAFAEQAKKTNVYAGACLSPADLGPTARCKADVVSAAVGLWADIDWGQEGHKKPDLPPSIDDALKIVERVGFKPTLTVNSGHGLQAWWLLKEPIKFTKPEERAAFAGLSQRWQETLISKSKELGYGCDSVGDLGRIMRVAGTMNFKDGCPPVPAVIVGGDGMRVGDVEDFDYYLVEAVNGRTMGRVDEGAIATLAGRLLIFSSPGIEGQKLGILLANNPKFMQTWMRSRTDFKDNSASSYCHSIAMQTIAAGWTEQEACNAMIVWRETCHLPPKDAHWYAYSLYKAQQAADSVTNPGGALGRIVAAIESSNGDMKKEDTRGPILDYLSKALNVEILGWVQHGMESPVYSLRVPETVIQNGTITIGGAAIVISRASFSKQLLPITKRVPSAKHKQWADVVNALGKIVEVYDDNDSYFLNKIGELIDLYLGNKRVCDEERYEEALFSRFPFTKDGMTWINAADFQKFIWTSQPEKFSGGEIRNALVAMKAEPRKFNINDRKTSRSYWGLPKSQ